MDELKIKLTKKHVNKQQLSWSKYQQIQQTADLDLNFR